MDIKYANELLTILADGIDPLTGEVLPSDHICNKPEIIRALNLVLKNINTTDKKLPENAGKPWIAEDDEILCKMFDEDRAINEICNYFQRTRGSISARLVRLGKINNRDEFKFKTTD